VGPCTTGVSGLATESAVLVDAPGIDVTMDGECEKVIGSGCDGCECLGMVEN
jgi:hypothetical protein